MIFQASVSCGETAHFPVVLACDVGLGGEDAAVLAVTLLSDAPPPTGNAGRPRSLRGGRGGRVSRSDRGGREREGAWEGVRQDGRSVWNTHEAGRD